MPTTTNDSLAQTAASQNLSAAPTIDALTQRIQQINQNAYLAAPGRSQELSTIQNQLSGNISPDTVYEAQLGAAERYGAGGFSTDSDAWQTAIRRALGLNREALISAGQQAMDRFYSGMPVANAQAQMESPALVQQQQATSGAQALEAQQLAQQAAQFQQTFGQNAARLYAGTYGTIPGYNEYGQYTGQTGTFPTAAQLNASMFPMAGMAPATASTGAGSTASLPATRPKLTQPAGLWGFDEEGKYVPGGNFGFGYWDRNSGIFHGNQQMPT